MLHPKPNPEPVAGMLRLTPQEVERLMRPESAVEGRMEVSGRVAANYAGGNFAAHESLIAEQIFRLLVRDTEVQVRAALAEQLKVSRTLPRDIALTMASDVEQVALPMLKYSEVLSDDDLIPLVRQAEAAWRQVAVAERRVVSEALSGALLEGGKQEVANALVLNEGAQLSDAAITHIYERFAASSAPMARLLARRPRLPASVSEKLMHSVSGALTDGLRRKHRLSAAQLKDEQAKAREAGTRSLLKQKESPEEAARLAEQLYAFGRLTPSLLFSSLAEGHVLFFEICMARLCNVAPESARTLLNDRGDLGFRAIYNKSGLPAELFGAARRLLAVAHELADTRDLKRGAAFSAKVGERLEQEGEVDNLPVMLALIRQDAAA